MLRHSMLGGHPTLLPILLAMELLPFVLRLSFLQVGMGITVMSLITNTSLLGFLGRFRACNGYLRIQVIITLLYYKLQASRAAGKLRITHY